MNAALQQLLLVTVTGLMVSCASVPEPQPADTTAGGPVDLEETQIVDTTLVCRTVPRTGSHMHEKRCYTRTELAKMEQNSRDFMRSRGAKGAVYTPVDPADPRKKDK